MSYTPGHLRFLDNGTSSDGWPIGVTEEGKQFALRCILLGFDKYEQMDLDLARNCIYSFYVTDDPLPECLKSSL